MSASNTLFTKALNSVGGRREFERKSRQYSESVHFIDENRNKLLESCDENWIAVHNSEIVAHNKNYHDVVKSVKQNNLPIEEVVLKYLSSRRVMTLF